MLIGLTSPLSNLIFVKNVFSDRGTNPQFFYHSKGFTMSTTLDRIKKRFEDIKTQAEKKPASTGNSLKWRPESGKQVIRLLPFKYNEDPDYPFLELAFYYKETFDKTWLSPASVGKHDPVIEYAQSLTARNLPPDEWTGAKNLQYKLMPKKTYYAPVLIRGKEHEGVKFWSFNPKIFAELLNIMSNDDYGLVSDIQNGTDLTLDFTPADDPRQNQYSIQPRRNSSPASEDPEVLKAIENMPNIMDTFTVPTSEELKAALRQYLSTDREEPIQPSKATESRTPVAASTASSPKPAAKPESDFDMNAIMDEFDKLLG